MLGKTGAVNGDNSPNVAPTMKRVFGLLKMHCHRDGDPTTLEELKEKLCEDKDAVKILLDVFPTSESMPPTKPAQLRESVSNLLPELLRKNHMHGNLTWQHLIELKWKISSLDQLKGVPFLLLDPGQKWAVRGFLAWLGEDLQWRFVAYRLSSQEIYAKDGTNRAHRKSADQDCDVDGDRPEPCHCTSEALRKKGRHAGMNCTDTLRSATGNFVDAMTECGAEVDSDLFERARRLHDKVVAKEADLSSLSLDKFLDNFNDLQVEAPTDATLSRLLSSVTMQECMLQLPRRKHYDSITFHLPRKSEDCCVSVQDPSPKAFVVSQVPTLKVSRSAEFWSFCRMSSFASFAKPTLCPLCDKQHNMCAVQFDENVVVVYGLYGKDQLVVLTDGFALRHETLQERLPSSGDDLRNVIGAICSKASDAAFLLPSSKNVRTLAAMLMVETCRWPPSLTYALICATAFPSHLVVAALFELHPMFNKASVRAAVANEEDFVKHYREEWRKATASSVERLDPRGWFSGRLLMLLKVWQAKSGLQTQFSANYALGGGASLFIDGHADPLCIHSEWGCQGSVVSAVEALLDEAGISSPLSPELAALAVHVNMSHSRCFAVAVSTPMTPESQLVFLKIVRARGLKIYVADPSGVRFFTSAAAPMASPVPVPPPSARRPYCSHRRYRKSRLNTRMRRTDLMHRLTAELRETVAKLKADGHLRTADLIVVMGSEGRTKAGKGQRVPPINAFVRFWSEWFLVIIVPESNTSKLCSSCLHESFHHRKHDKDIRSKCCRNCGLMYDRDEGAAVNMLRIIVSVLLHGTVPAVFCRPSNSGSKNVGPSSVAGVSGSVATGQNGIAADTDPSDSNLFG